MQSEDYLKSDTKWYIVDEDDGLVIVPRSVMEEIPFVQIQKIVHRLKEE